MNNFKSAKVAYVIFALVIFILVTNILYIGITGIHFESGSDIAQFANKRSTKDDIIYANRGTIFSDDGEVIATNVKKYRLEAIINSNRPGGAYVKDIALTANTVAPIIGMDPALMQEKLQTNLDAGKYQVEFGSYGNNLPSDIKKQIEDTKLPGLEFTDQNSRYYPMQNFASYTIGYAQNVEEKNGEDILKKTIGETGLEKVYNKQLSGENGFKVFQVDASGYTLPNGILREQPALNGNDMYLTLNANLQRDLELQLEKSAKDARATEASCAIMEAKTGKILAIANYPSFDPNERDITNHNDFFLDATIECGSVFKPFVYANAIDDGVYNGSATYMSGTFEVTGEKPINDFNDGKGWGRISYDEGLYRSSNTAICNLLDKYVSKESLISDLDKLGFFKKSDIDGLQTPAGIAGYNQNDNKRDYLTTGFGQGSTVTALQLLRAYSVFANNGKTVEPYLVDRIVNPNTKEVIYNGTPVYSDQVFSSETTNHVKDLLLGAVYDETSVAKEYQLQNSDIKIIGKTGTGQIAGDGGYRQDIYTKSFAGLAPYEDPEIVIYVAFQCPDKNTKQYIADVVKNMVPTALATKSEYSNNNPGDNGSTYQLDSYINQSADYVKNKLTSKGLVVEVIGNGGTIIDQFPNSKNLISINDRVFLKTDSNQITLPDMTGWSRKDVLTYASLSGVVIQLEGGSGLVTSQNVPPGTIVQPGSIVIITIQ